MFIKVPLTPKNVFNPKKLLTFPDHNVKIFYWQLVDSHLNQRYGPGLKKKIT